MEEKYLSVSQITSYISKKFSRDPYLERVFITGEISNFNPRSNSHKYFSLKDENSVMSSVMFKAAYDKVGFQPEDGQKVLASGYIGVYEPQGRYQFYIDRLEPDGIGALQVRFEQLKKQLAKEGLFDRLKRPLPRFPQKIAVVTSPSGAVIRDIMTTVQRRFPIVQLILYPSVVQGDKAKDSLVKNLKKINERDDIDTVIIGRGGGSIEDLWPFNEEEVVRQIAVMAMPVISSVGHETDVTLTDFVADVRAATPTAAAELAVPVLSEEIVKIDELTNRLNLAQQSLLADRQANYQRLAYSTVLRFPERLYQPLIEKHGNLNQNLHRAFQQKILQASARLNQVQGQLQANQPSRKIDLAKMQVNHYEEQLNQRFFKKINDRKTELRMALYGLEANSPVNILKRGYSLISDEDKMLESIKEVKVNQQVKVQLSDGSFTAQVKTINDKDKVSDK